MLYKKEPMCFEQLWVMVSYKGKFIPKLLQMREPLRKPCEKKV